MTIYIYTYTYNLEYIDYIMIVSYSYHVIVWYSSSCEWNCLNCGCFIHSTQFGSPAESTYCNSDGLQDILRQGALSTAGSLFPLNMTKGCSQENAMANSFAAWHLLPSCKDCHSCQGENSQSYDRVSNRGIETTRNKITSTIMHLKSYWHTGHP